MKNNGFFNKSDLHFVGWNIVLALFISGLILAGLIIWLRGYTQHGVEVTVADVTGMKQADAEAILHEQGLQMEVIDSTYSDKVPFGTIVDQDPKAESHAKHGRLVYVTVNATTRRQVAVPNLQDISYRQAETTLRALGLRVDTTYEYRPSAFRDLVLDVKCDGRSLEPGEKLPQGTRVKLVVGYGHGTEQVSVPNVIGMSLLNARSTILSKRLTVGAVNYDEEVSEGATPLVYRQTPAPGETLLEGETVALRLSIDPEKAVISSGNQRSDDEDEWF